MQYIEKYMHANWDCRWFKTQDNTWTHGLNTRENPPASFTSSELNSCCVHLRQFLCPLQKSESDHEDQAITSLAESSRQLGDDVALKSPTQWRLGGELKRETDLKLSTCDQTVQTDTEQSQDCDEYYFMSLVKTFKKLAPEKKTQVRMKIERILHEAEFEWRRVH